MRPRRFHPYPRADPTLGNSVPEYCTRILQPGLCPNLSRRGPPIARAPWGDQKYQWFSPNPPNEGV